MFSSLDLNAWELATTRERRVIALRVREACIETGFFYVARHGVPRNTVEAARANAKRFFALPPSKKLEIHFEKARKQRGYVPLRAESTASSPETAAPGDWKEALDFTYPVPRDGPSRPAAQDNKAAYRMYGSNLWPSAMPELRNAVEEYMEHMVALGRRVFSVLACSLELPTTYFDDLTDRPIGQLRFVHYPPLDRNRLSAADLGIGAHCDYECFTILHQDDDVVGLEVLSREEEWVAAAPREDTFAVNLGEMMERWTNGIYRAAPHRVVPSATKSRLSVPFFFGTNYDALIECVPTCRGSGRPPRYQPVEAGAYLASRLNEIYGSLPEAGN